MKITDNSTRVSNQKRASDLSCGDVFKGTILRDRGLWLRSCNCLVSLVDASHIIVNIIEHQTIIEDFVLLNAELILTNKDV